MEEKKDFHITTSILSEAIGISLVDIISVGINHGMLLSVNQQLDKETIEFICNEFGKDVPLTFILD